MAQFIAQDDKFLPPEKLVVTILTMLSSQLGKEVPAIPFNICYTGTSTANQVFAEKEIGEMYPLFRFLAVRQNTPGPISWY